MATYKLIQDIEAEDHILGPLSLRQFIFALLGAFCWYLSFIAFVKHGYFILVITMPPGLFFTFFAIPFGRDQPTEIWALAKLRFWFKPRRRLWDQSGVKELVTITVPKKVERVLTKGFSQSEVQSRLKALANTLDSRGWAIKNVNLGSSYTPSDILNQGSSDRLIDIGQAPQEVPSYDVQASDDILDETSNPVAQQFQSMITQSSRQHRQQLVDELNEIRTDQAGGQLPAPAVASAGGQSTSWFMNPPVATPVAAVPASSPAVAPVASVPASPPIIPLRPRALPMAYSHMRTLRPMSQTGTQSAAGQPAAASPAPSGATTPDPAILSLANNNDLNVSTLAREAYKATHDDEPSQNEVVVSLH